MFSSFYQQFKMFLSHFEVVQILCLFFLQLKRKSRDVGLQQSGVYRYKFACTECDKRYTLKSHLNRHMQLHTGEFSFYCPHCRKGFNSKNHCKDHMRTHLGLKYQCDYCFKTFGFEKNYKYHLSTHTGDYRFQCEICNKGFNAKKQLKIHTKSHNKPKQLSNRSP